MPEIIINLQPNLLLLSNFLLKLTLETNWTEELMCFQTIAELLANYYGTFNDNSNISLYELKQWYPLFNDYLIPLTIHENDGTIMKIAELNQLYKVFERC